MKHNSDKIFQDDYIFTRNEKYMLILALTLMQDELNKFTDKKCEYGDMMVSIQDIEHLKDYLNYG